MKFALKIYLILWSATVYNQEVVNQKELTLDRIFASNEFVPQRFGPHQWLAGGHFYTTVEYSSQGNSELILYDSETGERKILIAEKSLFESSKQSNIQIEDYLWSADEKTALIFCNSEKVWRTNTRGDYYLHNLKTKSNRKIGKDLPSSSLMFAKFNPSGDKIAYVSGHNIYVENMDDGSILKLTHDGTNDIINGTFDWAYEEEFFCKDGFRWSPDGQSIAFWQIDATQTKDFYMINNTDDQYSQIIPIQYPKVGETPSSARIGIIEIKNGLTHWVKLPGDPFQNYIPRIQWLTPTNKLLITQLSRKQNHLTLWLYDPADKSLNKVYEETTDTWIDIVNIDASAAWKMEDLVILDHGNSFVWVSEKDGWRHLFKISLPKGQIELLSPGDFDIASIKGVDKVNGMIYLIASPENATQRYLFQLDLVTKKIKRITPNQFTGINAYDVSPSGMYAIFKHQNSNTPTSGYMVKLPSHAIKDTLFNNKPFKSALQALDLPTVEFFKITTEDGIELDGKMIKPKNFDKNRRYPVLFEVYGEPAGQTAIATMDDLWHLFLAQKGYIIITMDNRGTPSLKGAAWRKSIYRNLGRINAEDQALAAKQIMQWPFIDSARIGVWGWSGGGAMTLNLLFKYPEIYKTGIAVAAVTNQLFYDNIYQERYMGLPSENIDDFIEGSPAAHASGLEGNLLYIHGTGDDNVHYQNAEFLINALIQENKTFDLMIYPNRSHGIYEGENTSRHLYTTMTRYLEKHLPPGSH